MKKTIVLGLILLLLVPFAAVAQDFCEGNFDYDRDQDGTDAFTFKTDFGRSILVDPCPGGFTAVAKTGQTASYALGDDGDLEKGVPWPTPRFADNGNGTVTDNLTGLLWARNANCFGLRTWETALSDCNGLSSGSCGLADGSTAGDWRLPSLSELESLRDLAYTAPPLSNSAGTGHWTEGDPFTGVQSGIYWSSSTTADFNYGWLLFMGYGDTGFNTKTNTAYAWCVRGGH